MVEVYYYFFNLLRLICYFFLHILIPVRNSLEDNGNKKMIALWMYLHYNAILSLGQWHKIVLKQNNPNVFWKSKSCSDICRVDRSFFSAELCNF